MLRGFYIAASGMVTNQRSLNAVANNISNANTAGYKRDQVQRNTFNEQLILVQERRAASGTFSQLYSSETTTSAEQGSLEFTSSPFDLAIQGPAWFNLSSAGGTLLTRNGQFGLDGDGYLALGASGRVLGENGEIHLGDSDFVVYEDGAIFNENGYVDTLLLTYIVDDNELEKVGENLYTGGGENILPDGESINIIQGAFEQSNVDAAYEMTKAMEIQRSYEACSAAIRMIDSINSSTTELGKI